MKVLSIEEEKRILLELWKDYKARQSSDDDDDDDIVIDDLLVESVLFTNLSNTVEEKQDSVPVVEHGTSDTTFNLVPNEFHVWGTVSSLTLTLANPVDTDCYAEYMFEFISGSTPTSLSISVPTGYPAIKWQEEWTPEANKIYQVSILNGIGLIISVDNE